MTNAWRDEYAIGIAEIDAQHHELCDAIDKLFISSSSGNCKEETKNIVQFLERYVIKHFHDEELLQQRCQYPGYTFHKKIHEDFKSSLAVLKQEAVDTDYSMAVMVKIYSTVLSWLIHHIAGEDQKIAQFINK